MTTYIFTFIHSSHIHTHSHNTHKHRHTHCHIYTIHSVTFRHIHKSHSHINTHTYSLNTFIVTRTESYTHIYSCTHKDSLILPCLWVIATGFSFALPMYGPRCTGSWPWAMSEWSWQLATRVGSSFPPWNPDSQDCRSGGTLEAQYREASLSFHRWSHWGPRGLHPLSGLVRGT